MENYKITDTTKGIFAQVELNEGIFNLEIKQLPFNKIDGNRRTFEVVGNYPKENYSISYEAGKLFILKKGGSFEVGQDVTHKIFGKGKIINISENSISIKIGEDTKTLMKSIAINFLN